jgi:hypothetical protein
MVYFQTKKSQFGKMWVYFKVIWYISWPFYIFCGNLVHFSRFGVSHQEKSGNPGRNAFYDFQKFWPATEQ